MCMAHFLNIAYKRLNKHVLTFGLTASHSHKQYNDAVQYIPAHYLILRYQVKRIINFKNQKKIMMNGLRGSKCIFFSKMYF